MDFLRIQSRWVRSAFLSILIATFSYSALAETVQVERSDLREIQEKLQLEGLYSGEIDGLLGGKTKKAVKTFAKNKELGDIQGIVINDTRIFVDKEFYDALMREPTESSVLPTEENSSTIKPPATIASPDRVQTLKTNIETLDNNVRSELSKLSEKTATNGSDANANKEAIKSIDGYNKILMDQMSSLTKWVYGAFSAAFVAALTGLFAIYKVMKNNATELEGKLEKRITEVSDLVNQTEKTVRRTNKNLKEAKLVSEKAHVTANEIKEKWDELETVFRK